MKIVTKKQEKGIERIRRQNEFLSKGWKAMNICLDYQKAIVAILETLGIEEIEINNALLLNEKEIEVMHTIDHTIIIKIK